MLHTLSNEYLTVSVEDHGAELRSIVRKADNREMLWQADPKFWPRTSPILFPLVGNFYGKKYRYDGKVYEMSQHGFARDMDFKLISENSGKLVLEISDTAETHENYPFSFRLQCGYELKGNKLEVIWKVINTDNKKMYFSIGAHPGFNCDLNRDKILFEKAGKTVNGSVVSKQIAGDKSGCLSDEEKELPLTDGILPLSDELFMKDALIIEDKQADAVTVVAADGNRLARVSFDAPLFGVWSPNGKHAPFVCIEPWYGRCDRAGFNGSLEEREYGNCLAPSEEFNASYVIEIF